MLSQMPRIDVAELYSFADKVVRPDREDAYRAVQELLSQFLARMIARAARQRLDAADIIAGEGEVMQRLAARTDLARWVALREEIDQSFVNTDQLNLDRKQAVLSAFFAIEEMAR
jgi:DNA polymerase III subunit delta'